MKQIIQDFINLIIFWYLLATRQRIRVSAPIQKIKCITFRKFAPKGGVGGGSAALSMNQCVLGSSCNGIPLSYQFLIENHWSHRTNNQLWDLFGAVKFVFNTCKHDSNTAYITHDYGTAFGLYLLGKKYISISHIQGTRVEEKQNFAEQMSRVTKYIIQSAERRVYQSAIYNSYPSYGAYVYFCKSPYKKVNPNEFKLGPILYNTLWVHPKSQPYLNFEREPNKLTFLSIGQLTTSKGMDRQVKFFSAYLKNAQQPVRYIFKANGPLEDKILHELNKLKELYPTFEYFHIKERLTNEHLSHLQDIADVYIMLHRISIFDMATLEMMYKSKPIILSAVGGNLEFNQNDNILFLENDDYDKLAGKFNDVNLFILGKKNKIVYEKYFSNTAYRKAYQSMISQLVSSS